jgi:ADP-ribosyl-[dinitrogen reductase] hydrolase
MDRITGCLLGGALGDALGAPVERGSTARGSWLTVTDDTQLTLATCDAIVAAGGVDPAAIADAFARGQRVGAFTDVGASTHQALSALAVGGHWALVGAKGERAAGNGAAMRVAPLAFLVDPCDADDRVRLRDVCRITHHHDEAYAGALAVVTAVRAAFLGAWSGSPDLLHRCAAVLPDSRVRDRLRELDASAHGMPLVEVARRWGNGGHVVESVPLALCGAERVLARGFAPMLDELVACGGDADTVASIAGQVAGALLGEGALPMALLERLVGASSLRGRVASFAAFVARTAGLGP